MGHAELVKRIEERWGFSIPADYRSMLDRGWLTLDGPGRFFFEYLEPGGYLAVWEMEWMPLEETRDHRFNDWERQDFVPFAVTGMGDHWCWWPERNGVVVLCPHDDQMGTIHAPDVLTAVYRQALELAGNVNEGASVEQVRAQLDRYAADLGPLLPEGCRETLEWVRGEPLKSWSVGRWKQEGLITPEERGVREMRDLHFAGLDEKFLWHHPRT